MTTFTESFMNASYGNFSSSKHHFSDVLRMYIDYTAMTPISCIGIIGNFLTVVVFSAMKQKRTYHYFMLCLSVFDFLFCVIAGGSVIAKQFKTFWKFYYHYYAVHFVSRFVAANSYCLVAILSCDRLIAIVWPIKSVVWLKTRGTRMVYVVTCFLVVLSASFHIPYLFSYDPTDEVETHRNGSTGTGNQSEFIDGIRIPDKIFRIIHGINVVCFIYGSIAIVFVCNAIVIAAMRIRRSRLASLQQDQQIDVSENNEVTKMLLCMSFVFLICVSMGSGSLRHQSTFDFDADNIRYIIQEIWDVLYLINHSVNFIVYILWTKKYRKYYWRAISCKPIEWTVDVQNIGITLVSDFLSAYNVCIMSAQGADSCSCFSRDYLC